MTPSYRVEIPGNVVSITRAKHRPHNRRWILLAVNDDSWTATRAEVEDDNVGVTLDQDQGEGFSDLLDTVGLMASSRKTTWIICFRSRYLLQKCRWIEALAEGKIELERQRKLAGKQAGAGRVCLSQGFTDIDLRIGGRKVKLLDWQNFGVELSDFGLSPNEQTAEHMVEIFKEFIHAYSQTGLSASKTSAAQAGWSILRRSLGSSNVFTSLDPEIRRLERRCYYGGRCEPFKIGDYTGRAFLIDVKGAYASICRDALLPIQPLRYYPDGCAIPDRAATLGLDWAIDCVVKTDLPIYPVRNAGKVVYPIGEFFTSLCGAEAKIACNRGDVKQIVRAVSYARHNVLHGYAEWYMEARAPENTDCLGRCSGALKSAFNSSLGFLARQGREWQEWSPAGSVPWWFGVTNDPDDHGKIVSAHTLKGETELLRIGSEPRNASPILHASICAEGRQRLWNLILVAGMPNVLYCDTDGLIVTQAGLDRLDNFGGLFGDEFGKLSIRHQANRCTINGQKSYKIGDKVVCAGLAAADHKRWKKAEFKVSRTGVADQSGNVEPFKLRCEDMGGENAKWKNYLC